MPWNLLKRSRPRSGVMWRLCFYCNENSSVYLTYRRSTNSYAWTCPLCEAINVIDETGEIVDFTPEGFSPSESDPTVLLSSTNHETESPFCKNCQVNHRIVMEALATYLPPESDPQYQVYERKLPMYKVELERRYPPYCDKCRSTVVSKLSENNYNARSRILGTFLHNKAGTADLRSSSFATNSNEFESPSGGKILHPKWTFQTWLKLVIWICRGVLWWSHILSFCVLFAINSLYPALQLRKLALAHAENNQSIGSIFKVIFDKTVEVYVTRNQQHDAYFSGLGVSLFSLMHRITPFSILYFFWNYKLLYALLSSTRVSVTGKSDYYRCQCLLFVQLLVGLYMLPRMYYWNVPETAFRLVNLFFATTTTLMLAVSLACLRVRPVEYTDMQPQIQHPTDDNYSEIAKQSVSPQAQLQSTSFLNIPHFVAARPGVPSNTPGVEVPNKFIDDDMMDWKPSFVPEIFSTDVAPAKLPDIPKLPPGYSLAPPPNGSKLNVGMLNASEPVASQSSGPMQGREKYFQHKLASVSHTQCSSTGTTNELRNRDIALAAQRFFPKEDPTGLEDLFDPVLRLSDSAGLTSNSAGSEKAISGKETRANGVHKPTEWLSASAIVIGILAVVIYVCRRVMPVPDQWHS
ncbi:Ima1 N-terminal domain-containing protein [Lipomyces kononenkoae]